MILGNGTSFVYRDGKLCYVDGRCIRILDLHQASDVEEVIDLDVIGQHIWKRPKALLRIELLHYQDGVLSLLYYTPSTDEHSFESETSWLVAINIERNVPLSQKIRLAVDPPNSKFWVRNDSRYLYVGSHDGIGEHRHHEWVLQGYSLTNGQLTKSLQLCNLFGTDLRQTVIFEIIDGYVYALSNQSSFEVEEIDWTSFYHCYRFPVTDPVQDRLDRTDIWRRQHREGPINDSWTDLGLHKDERTGLLQITECRREWKDGLSTQKRTYYSQPLVFPGETQASDRDSTSSVIAADDSLNGLATTRHAQYPFDDPLYKAASEDNKPLYSDPVPRIHRNFHEEYPTTDSPPQTFILAKTKHRTSIPASNAYFDLVQDSYTPPPTHPSPPRYWQQQIRLRIGSRSQSSPYDEITGLLHERTLDPADNPIPGSEERFKDRGIRLWPPANAPVELLDLLNPAITPGSSSRLIGEVTAVSDERSVVYMPGSLFRSDGVGRNIVLVNFDPEVRFSGLAPLTLEHDLVEDKIEVVLSRKGEGAASGADLETRIPKQIFNEAGMYGQAQDIESTPRSWWREERARHLDIARGYRFEYEKVK